MEELVKAKKFYKVKEKVWLKTLKRAAIVLSLNTNTKEAEVSYFDDNDKLVRGKFMFWEINKYHKAEKPIEIFVKYFTEFDTPTDNKEGYQPIEEIKVGNWIDLRASEDVVMSMFDHKLIPLGVAMQLPEGYEGWVVPRSSTIKKFGIIQANHIGIIDNSYCGDNDQWFMSAIAMRDTVIKRGDRICQFRIMPIMGSVEFRQVDKLGNADRGGFGSTGG